MILRISDEICINDVRGKGFHPNYAVFNLGGATQHYFLSQQLERTKGRQNVRFFA